MWAHQDPVLVYLTLDGEQIETTPEHPFYVVEQGWVAAGDLQVGDLVRRADGREGSVQAVVGVRQPQPMYNLTVEQAHTYFVGVDRWLVHNNNGCIPKSPTGKGSVPLGQRDPKRVWTLQEKSKGLDAQSGNSLMGGELLDIGDARGHLIIRHADGGMTVDDNLAVLYSKCHKEIRK